MRHPVGQQNRLIFREVAIVKHQQEFRAVGREPLDGVRYPRAPSSAGFLGTGSLRLRSLFALRAGSWLCPAVWFAASIPAARAAELAPKNPRRVQRSFSDSSSMYTASLGFTRLSSELSGAR